MVRISERLVVDSSLNDSVWIENTLDDSMVGVYTKEEAEALIVELQKFIAYKNKQDD